MKEITLHILDLVQNSIRAEASLVEITIIEKPESNFLSIAIKDNGIGMTEEIARKAVDPFFTSRTTRSVGLGIPLFKQLAEQCNGKILLTSEPEKGTSLIAEMELNHIDRQPMGDIAGVLVLLMTANPGIRFIYSHTTQKGNYVFDTSKIRETLETDVVNDPGILKFIREMIEENLKEIGMRC